MFASEAKVGQEEVAECERKLCVDGYDVVYAIGADVRVPAHGLRVIVAVGAVGGRVLREVCCHGILLVRGHGKDVGESVAGEDDALEG